jgi:predicted Zn-dependent protease with MMP-like domain
VSRKPADQRLYHHPPSADDIEAIGRQVLDELPETFRGFVRGVVITVQDFADEATLRDLAIDSPFDLLGLYSGVPVGHAELTQRDDVDRIYLYRRPLLDYWCETGNPLADIVLNTLIHEIGHHFGFSDDDMEAIEFGEDGPR